MKRKRRRRREGGRAEAPTQAMRADRHDLYERSVQMPDVDVGFFSRVFRRTFGRHALLLREDFCGTFALCCDWVKSGGRKLPRRAIGVDLDAPTLAWGQEHNLASLSPKKRDRITLYHDDVRVVGGEKSDIVAAQNFSYFIFKTRQELRTYFQAAYDNLADEGLFIVDLLGGHLVIKHNHTLEERKLKGFTYEWEQLRFNPMTHDVLYRINFRFKDGSRIDEAFRYDWRLWSIPEVREIMAEVGFMRSVVHWEGTDEATGQGDGIYTPTTDPDNDPAWVSYVIAVKEPRFRDGDGDARVGP